MTFVSAFCDRFYYLDVLGFSLWQAVFVAAALLALAAAPRLLRRWSGRTLAALAAVLFLGAALRWGLSPRNVADANYRGMERFSMLRGFHKVGLADVAGESHYYAGYGQAEYWKLFLGRRSDAGFDKVLLINGITSSLTILLVFAASFLILGSEEAGLWCAFLAALSPLGIRFAFGDGVYGFGGTLILLSLIQFLLFFETGSALSLAPALGFAYCLLYTHLAFLPFPLMVPLFYPLAGRRWRDAGGLLSKRGFLLVALFALAVVPAYVVSPAAYKNVAAQSQIGSPWDVLRTLAWFLTHEVNSFFNPALNSRAVMLLSLLGLAALLARTRAAFFAVAGSIAVLTLPLPYGAVWLGPEGNRFIYTGALKQEHLAFFYFLAGGHALCLATKLAGRRARFLAAGVLACALLIQPFLYRGFISREFNCQRELSFIREFLAGKDRGELLFSTQASLSRVLALNPGRFGIHAVSLHNSRHGNASAPVLRQSALGFLDWLLSEGEEAVFYLSLDCYYRHPLDRYEGKGSPLRDDCEDFLGRYRFEPVLEETFESSPYNIEFDHTEARSLKLGFYRIRPKAPLKPAKALSPIPEFDVLRRSFYLKRAEDEFDAGRPVLAAAALGRVWELSPAADELPRLHHLQMRRQASKPGAAGERDRALEALDALVKTQTANASLLVDRAQLLSQRGRREEALEALSEAGSLKPGETELRRMASLARSMDSGLVLSALGRLAVKQPKDAGVQVERAEVLLDRGRRAEAVDALGQAKTGRPRDELLVRIEVLYRKMGEFERALGVFDARHAGLRLDAAALTDRADLLASLGRYDDARRSLAQARSLKPGEAELRRIALLAAALDPDLALSALGRLSAKRPKDAGVQVERAEALLGLGRREEALSAFTLAKGLSRTPDLSRRIARGLQVLDRCGQALQLWGELTAGPAPTAKDFSDKAVCAYRQGDWETAVADLRRAISLAPDGVEAYVSLAAVYAGRGLLRQALDVYDRGLALKPRKEDEGLRNQLSEGRGLVLQRLREAKP
ncbi:MAG: tetratricopeptide repeat protein [Elusimicrobiota bacterium]